MGFIEVYWLSIGTLLEKRGVVGRFERWPDGPKPSCNINVRSGSLEIDLMIWVSGEAELIFNDHGGVVSSQHFDDIRDPHELSAVLSRLISFPSEA